MKTKIELGDTVKTWCCGAEVVGKVIDTGQNYFVVEHEPVKWGRDTYTKTVVKKSTPLQRQFYSETSPVAFKGGVPVVL